MVYCGLPSKACLHCRGRRIKCDQSRPSCSQCIRAHLTCGGYRKPLDLMFRDQTEDVAHKVGGSPISDRRQTSPEKRTETPTLTASSIDDQFRMTSKYTGLIPTSPPLHVEDLAACFFFTEYTSYSPSSLKSVYNHLPDLYNEASTDSGLRSIIDALGIAKLSRGAPEMMAIASTKYNSSLSLVNRALRDYLTATADETLLSVLLLGLYEMKTGIDYRSINYWLQHINGAATLLELRGEEQLNTEIGRLMFFELRAKINIFCLNMRIPVPRSICKLSRISRPFESDYDLEASKLTDMVARLCDLRASEGFPPNCTRSIDTAKTAISLAHDLAEWNNQIQSKQWYYSVAVPELSPEVLSDHYDVYHDVALAKLLNNYRSIHLLVHELIIGQLTDLHGTCSATFGDQFLAACTTQINKSKAANVDLVHELCASVPYLLDYHLQQHQHQHGPTPGEVTVQTTPKAIGCNSVVWPLYVGTQIEYVAPAARVWMLGRLEKMAATHGIHQAAVLARLVRGGRVLDEVIAERELGGGGGGCDTDGWVHYGA